MSDEQPGEYGAFPYVKLTLWADMAEDDEDGCAAWSWGGALVGVGVVKLKTTPPVLALRDRLGLC